MLPHSRGLILDNTQNYGIMKTEAVFGFGPQQNNVNNSFNNAPLEWIFTNGSFQKRSLQEESPPTKTSTKDLKRTKKTKKSKKRQSKKVNKCIIKFLKKGQGQKGSEESSGKRRRRKGSQMQKMQKKYMMPLILGLLAAKSILIPIALKALAFMSAKGLVLAFFSTVMASVMSLKGMYNHPHEYHNRKDDAKTQVEIIQVPTKSEDHVYYDDVHYRRGDYVFPNDVYNSESNLHKKGLRNKDLSAEVNKIQGKKLMPDFTNHHLS